MSKVRSSGCAFWSSREKIPHIQGKRNPSKTVGAKRGHQRAGTLNHNHRQLADLVTWTTTLSNSVKLSHARGATQDGREMVETSDRMRSTGEGNGNHFTVLALRTP